MLDYNVAKAWENLLTGTNTWVVSGTGSDASSYEITFALKPGPVSMFPYSGASGARAELTITIKVDGAAEPADLTYLFFNASTFGVFGDQNVTDNSCSAVTAAPPLPTSVALGASGALYDAIDYAGCSAPSTVDGTSTAGWSLEPDSGNALFCFNVTERSSGSAILGTQSFCAQTDHDGTLGSKARITVTEPGFSLTARN